MVGVPERLEALLSNFVVRSRVDEKHQEEHDVTRESARLRVHDPPRRLLADLGQLNVKHVDVCEGEEAGCASALAGAEGDDSVWGTHSAPLCAG